MLIIAPYLTQFNVGLNDRSEFMSNVSEEQFKMSYSGTDTEESMLSVCTCAHSCYGSKLESEAIDIEVYRIMGLSFRGLK